MIFPPDADFNPEQPQHSMWGFLKHELGLKNLKPWDVPYSQVGSQCPDFFQKDIQARMKEKGKFGESFSNERYQDTVSPPAGIAFQVVELYVGDLYVIPRGTLHYFQTTAVPHCCIGWNNILGSADKRGT